jgi:hypothetical protein
MLPLGLKAQTELDKQRQAALEQRAAELRLVQESRADRSAGHSLWHAPRLVLGRGLVWLGERLQAEPHEVLHPPIPARHAHHHARH